MTPRQYWVLDPNGDALAIPDLDVWATWFATSGPQRQLALTRLGDRCCVSTVFLGLDWSLGVGETPILWETQVFGGPCEGWTRQYRTKAAALAGHALALADVRARARHGVVRTE